MAVAQKLINFQTKGNFMNTDTYYVGISTHLYTDEFYVFKRKLPKNKTIETDLYYGSGFYIKGFSKSYLKKYFSIDILGIFYNDEISALSLESDIIDGLMNNDCMNFTSFTMRQIEPDTRYNSKPIYINNVLYKSRSYAGDCLNISKGTIKSVVNRGKKVVKSNDGKYYILGKIDKVPSQKYLARLYKEERRKVLQKARLGSKNPQAISLIIDNKVYSTIKEGCKINNIGYLNFIKAKARKQTKYEPKNDNRVFYIDYSGPITKVTIEYKAG